MAMSSVVFEEATHTYTVDGQVLPSVTEICRFLNYDVAVGANTAMRDYAADRGTRIHEACTLFDFEGDEADVDSDIVGYVQAYAAFKRDYGVTDWLYYEKPLGNLELWYAGTPDRVGVVDGKMTIVDFKSGTKINKYSLEAQLNGYARLVRHELGIGINRLWGLQLKKDGNYRIIEVPIRNQFFLNCQTLHRFLEGEYNHE